MLHWVFLDGFCGGWIFSGSINGGPGGCLEQDGYRYSVGHIRESKYLEVQAAVVNSADFGWREKQTGDDQVHDVGVLFALERLSSEVRNTEGAVNAR